MSHPTTIPDPLRFVGLDVHVETITMVVAHSTGDLGPPVQFRNEPTALTKALRKAGPAASLRVCYEAGPCGYTIYRQLTALGIACAVVAPSLIPQKAGDRIKTDRRDAAKLARLLRSGDLTTITVPTPDVEAVRDLSRLREQAVSDLHRARQRLLKFLVRHGIPEPPHTTRWTQRYTTWLTTVTLPSPTAQFVFDDLRATIAAATTRRDAITQQLTAPPADATPPPVFAPVIAGLQQLHGIGPIIATGIVAEVGDLTRFAHPRHLMAYAGLVPSEASSGRSVQRGGITKTGNTHLRRLLVEAAWLCIRPARTGSSAAAAAGAAGAAGADDPLTQLAQRARTRLYRRFWRLVQRGKSRLVAIIAVARELVGFIWGVAQLIPLVTPASPSANPPEPLAA